MQEINIQSHGFELDENIRTYINQQLHYIFGLEKYLVQKVVIKLFEDNSLQNDENQCCYIRVEVSNQPAIITELKSLDIFTAIDLALERAMLKVSHRLNGKNAFRKRLFNKRDELLHG